MNQLRIARILGGLLSSSLYFLAAYKVGILIKHIMLDPHMGLALVLYGLLFMVLVFMGFGNAAIAMDHSMSQSIGYWYSIPLAFLGGFFAFWLLLLDLFRMTLVFYIIAQAFIKSLRSFLK